MWKRWVDNKSSQGTQRMNELVKSLLLRRTKVFGFVRPRALGPHSFFAVPDSVVLLNSDPNPAKQNSSVTF